MINQFEAYLLPCVLFAFLLGGTPERIAAGLMLMAVVASRIIFDVFRADYLRPSMLLMLVDVSLGAALLVLMLRANRQWPMLLLALHCCTLLGHLARSIGLRMDAMNYYILSTKWSYLMIALLVVATLRHRLRLWRLGDDQPWSPPS